MSQLEELDFNDVPICTEGITNDVTLKLVNLGKMISGTVIELDSDDRKKLHMAAVITNNFSNHLYDLAKSYLREQSIDPSLLDALIRETARKAVSTNPAAIQTGPAKRGDEVTIASHLSLLANQPHLKKIYTLLTDSIANNNNETQL